MVAAFQGHLGLFQLAYQTAKSKGELDSLTEYMIHLMMAMIRLTNLAKKGPKNRTPLTGQSSRLEMGVPVLNYDCKQGVERL